MKKDGSAAGGFLKIEWNNWTISMNFRGRFDYSKWPLGSNYSSGEVLKIDREKSFLEFWDYRILATVYTVHLIAWKKYYVLNFGISCTIKMLGVRGTKTSPEGATESKSFNKLMYLLKYDIILCAYKSTCHFSIIIYRLFISKVVIHERRLQRRKDLMQKIFKKTNFFKFCGFCKIPCLFITQFEASWKNSQ